MNILEIIEKKTKGYELTKEEIECFVNGYTTGEIKACLTKKQQI